MPRPTKSESSKIRAKKQSKSTNPPRTPSGSLTPGTPAQARALGKMPATSGFSSSFARGSTAPARTVGLMDTITLSSGSESEGDPSQGRDYENEERSLDDLADLQSSGTRHVRVTKKWQAPPKSTLNSRAAEESDGSLSDGEIRETESATAAMEISSRSPNPTTKKTAEKGNKGNFTKLNSPLPVKKPKAGETELSTPAQKLPEKKTTLPKLAINLNLTTASTTPEKTQEYLDVNSPGFIEDVAPSTSSESDKEDENGVRRPSVRADTNESEGLALVQVTFLNKYIAQKYDSMFRKLVSGILSKERGNMDKIREAAENKTPVTIVYHDCFEEDTNADEPEKQAGGRSKSNLYGLHDDFIPDLPANASDEEEEDLAAVETPKPTQSYSKQKECFNCGGNHTMDKCTEPMDYARVAAKRQQFFNSSSPMMGSGRYHDANLEEEDRIKPGEFPDCVPGQVSDELLAALGLTRSDLPPWIPRMRACGYPPGHIRNCIVETSGLDFITEDSVATIEKVKYDLTKLPIYPGLSGPHTKEVAKSPMVRHQRDEPYEHQSHGTILSFLSDLAVRETVEARSPSPEGDAGDGDGDDMDMSEEESTADDGVETAKQPEDDEAAEGKAVNSWTESTSPDVPPAETNETDTEPAASIINRPPLEHAFSLPTSLLVREEQFELTESPSAPPVIRRDARLLKTSSVPELGSFSGLGDLPDNEKFAQGVAPWPFEEATQSTGRYNLIRDALEQTRKRKLN